MKPSGAHTHPETGGGGLAAALAVAAVFLMAAIAEPVAQAMSGLMRVVVEVLEIIGVVIAAAVGLAILAALVYLVARLRQYYRYRVAVRPSRQPPVIIRQPAQDLANQAWPHAELESRLSRIERQLAGDDRTDDQPLAIDAPLVSPDRLPVDRTPRAVNRSRTDAYRG